MKTAGPIAALLLIAATPVLAQEGEIFEQGSYGIEGIPTQCETQTLVSPTAPLLIQVLAGGQIMQIDASRFDPLPPGVRLFVYYHTCMNSFFGDAAMADQYAVSVGLRQAWLAVQDVQAICETDLIPAEGWPDKPDAARCAEMYADMREALGVT